MSHRVYKYVAISSLQTTGMDLALDISKKATRVLLSHHSKDPIDTVFPDNVVQVSDGKRNFTIRLTVYSVQIRRNRM